MFNKRDKAKKEYLKYKDGKVVSFEDEELEKPVKNSLDVDALKNKTNEKIKDMGPQKLIKLIGAFVLFLFTIYVAFSVYDSFKNGEVGLNKGKENEEDKGLFSKDKTDEEIDLIIKSNEEIVNKKNTSSKGSKNSMLASFNEINTSLYNSTVLDFARLNDYDSKMLNRISLTNELKKNLDYKNKLKTSLLDSEDLYKGVTAELLFETLISRMNNSIALSEGLIKELDLNVKTKDMDSVIDLYSNKEIVLKENEIILLKKYLEAEKIDYKTDRETGVLQYDY